MTGAEQGKVLLGYPMTLDRLHAAVESSSAWRAQAAITPMWRKRSADLHNMARQSTEPTQLCVVRSCSLLMGASRLLSTKAAWTLSWGKTRKQQMRPA